MEVIGGFPNLAVLTVNGSVLTDDGMKYLRGLKKLTHLNVMVDYLLTQEDYDKWYDRFPNLDVRVYPDLETLNRASKFPFGEPPSKR